MKPIPTLIFVTMIVLCGEWVAHAIAQNQGTFIGILLAIFFIVVFSVREAQKEKR